MYILPKIVKNNKKIEENKQINNKQINKNNNKTWRCAKAEFLLFVERFGKTLTRKH